MVRRVQFFVDYFIQCCQQTLTRGETVNGDIFYIIRDLDVYYRWCVELFVKIGRNATVGFVVINLELANVVVGMGKRKVIGVQRMRKVGGVKIQIELIGFRLFNLVFEVFWFDLVARDWRI